MRKRRKKLHHPTLVVGEDGEEVGDAGVVEGRRQTLVEKNLLAAENERIRAEQAREKNERSERALNKLIESRTSPGGQHDAPSARY